MIRSRVFPTVLNALTLAIAVGVSSQSHAHSPLPESAGSGPVAAAQSGVATATPSHLYRSAIGDRVFTPQRLKRLDSGYTVEYGHLRSADESALSGSAQGETETLLMVRSPAGGLTAIVRRDGHSGLLSVSPEGQEVFYPDQPSDSPQAHAPAGQAQPRLAEAPTTPAILANDEPAEVKTLVGFTADALASRPGVDPLGFALAQLELVNMSLADSRVDSLRLGLAGIRVHDESIPVNGVGLERWRNLMIAHGRPYHHDIAVGVSIGGAEQGLARTVPYTSVQSIDSQAALRQNLGIMAGGRQCLNAPNPRPAYNFGFRSPTGHTSILCSNGIATHYYSNPDLIVHGHPFGHEKANMARVLREQTSSLSTSSSPFPGPRLFLVSPSEVAQIALGEGRSPLAGVVALSDEVGPTHLTHAHEGYTMLTANLLGTDGREQPVRLRATRQVQGCPAPTPMNSDTRCDASLNDAPITLDVRFTAEDNPALPTGWYNGVIQLKALPVQASEPEVPLLVSLAVRK